MATKFSKKKIQKNKPKQDPSIEELKELYKMWDSACEYGENVAIVNNMSITMEILKEDYGWSYEDLAIFADKFTKKYNAEYAGGKVTPKEYAERAYKNAGIRFESDWLE